MVAFDYLPAHWHTSKVWRNADKRLNYCINFKLRSCEIHKNELLDKIIVKKKNK